MGPRSSIFPSTSSDECGLMFNFVGDVKLEIRNPHMRRGRDFLTPSAPARPPSFDKPREAKPPRPFNYRGFPEYRAVPDSYRPCPARSCKSRSRPPSPRRSGDNSCSIHGVVEDGACVCVAGEAVALQLRETAIAPRRGNLVRRRALALRHLAHDLSCIRHRGSSVASFSDIYHTSDESPRREKSWRFLSNRSLPIELGEQVPQGQDETGQHGTALEHLRLVEHRGLFG